MAAGLGKLNASSVFGVTGLLLDSGDLELNFDLLGDQYAAGLQRSVEVDAEVLAVDLGGCLEAQAGIAKWVLSGSNIFYIEVDGLGGVLDGEVTGYGAVAILINVEVGGLEGDLRVLLYCEEVLVLYVCIAVIVAGGDGSGADGCLSSGLGDVLGHGNGALKIGEVATDLGDHCVLGDESDNGVGWV